MRIGSFEAFAMPTRGARIVDHTYVVVDGVHRFGCHGRFVGGNVIARGVGNVDLGRCLAAIDGKAGIRYGLSGVCHQTANRILLPARKVVHRAIGFKGSVLVWGLFGRQGHRHHSPRSFPWPELNGCVSIHGGP